MEGNERDLLVRENMPYVERIIMAEQRRLGSGIHVEKDDIRSFALEGLAYSIDRYDPGRNVPFMAYAASRIRGAIFDGLCQSSAFPRRLLRKIAYYQKAEMMIRSYADTPPPDDKVEAVHRLADTLKELATAYVTTYAAETETESESPQDNADINLERRRFRTELMVSVSALPKKQQHVVHAYFFEDLTLTQIAERMSISKSWVSKLLNSGLASLRKSFGMNRAEEALDAFS
ncbi:MAG: sigma-70 family RNA polymerase sigma factor [Deltaproteobacteria bacterium]|nr:sigma-70 family RNA polymerase sigma factor [Deltaproteobacteria bacterium]